MLRGIRRRNAAIVAGQAARRGNALHVYRNGDAIFPRLLDAIRASRTTVHFSWYVFWSGEMAEIFADAFPGAARRGVDVRLIVDSELIAQARPTGVSSSSMA